ncbi:MAG: hypothetical protein AAB436_02665 [Patescibacteria group bacterium]
MSIEQQQEEAVSAQTIRALSNDVIAQVHFSDVIAEAVDVDDALWWRRTDFDAGLTIHSHSNGLSGVEQIPIGYRPWLANYGLVLVDDLLIAQNERELAKPGPELFRERDEHGQSVVALANYAPRDQANTADNQNGSDFFLATTEAGLEIYATPLSFLSGLEARNRITSLYRIPTAGHPEFDGEHEQFRSARVVRTREHPDHLVPVFQYQDVEELITAKREGDHPDAIPTDPRAGHIAYVDKFGNVRGELDDISRLDQLETGQSATLRVTNKGHEQEIEVHVAEDLHSAPLGKLAVYVNCSDYNGAGAGYVEIMTRVNDNPSTSHDTAIFQLQGQLEGELDIDTAEIDLIAK